MELNAKVAKLYSLTGHGEPIRFWAEAGRVAWRDARDGSYGTMSCKQAEDRTKAVQRRVAAFLRDGENTLGVKRMKAFLEDMEEVLRLAKSQRAEIVPKLFRGVS